MLVELDMFSGRPNPRWQLHEPASRELKKLLARLHRTAGAPPEPPGLGYRGFVFTESGRSTRAYGGYVRGGRVVLADPTRSIEHFLLDRMPAELASLRPRVAQALNGGDRRR